MHYVGKLTFRFGLAWFLLSVVAICVLSQCEQFDVHLPMVDGIGLLIYFGLYFGSWLVMTIGLVLKGIGTLIDHRSEGS